MTETMQTLKQEAIRKSENDVRARHHEGKLTMMNAID